MRAFCRRSGGGVPRRGFFWLAAGEAEGGKLRPVWLGESTIDFPSEQDEAYPHTFEGPHSVRQAAVHGDELMASTLEAAA